MGIKKSEGVVVMIFTKLIRSIQSNSNSLFNSVAIAVLTVVTSSSVSMAEKFSNGVIPSRLADGISVYGESERPDIVGQEYMVIEKVGNKTVGAFYLPRSDFSCFYGRVRGSELNITLIDGYDRQKYNYSLALNSRGLTASRLPMMGTPTYKPLGEISNNDRRILNSCKSQLQSDR